MRQVPELVTFLKLLNSRPRGILGYVTTTSEVWECHDVSVSINQKSTHACVICVWR